jgi:hypothetical protein
MGAGAGAAAEAALAAVEASLAAADAGGGGGNEQAGQLAWGFAAMAAAAEHLSNALGAMPAGQAAPHAAAAGAWLAGSAGQLASLLDRALAEAAAARASSRGGAREWLGLLGQAASLVVSLDKIMVKAGSEGRPTFWTLVKASGDLDGPRRVEGLARLWPSVEEVRARGQGSWAVPLPLSAAWPPYTAPHNR